jgi:hypothetical protein
MPRLAHRRGFGVLVAALVLGGLAGGAPAAAQSTNGLSFIGGLGYERGNPGSDLVYALNAAGLDGVRPGRCAGPYCNPDEQYPFHFADGIGLTLSMGFRYRFTLPVSLEAMVSNGPRGHAEGFDDVTNDHLIVSYSAFVLASSLGVHIGSLRLAAGPAFLSTGWAATYNAADTEKTTSVQLGTTVGMSYGLRVGDAVLSLRASVNDFPRDVVPNPMDLPIQAQYRTYRLGVTVNPWAY